MIKLTDNLVIKSDATQYTLCSVTTNKKGETVYNAESYHGTLKEAVKAARRYTVKRAIVTAGDVTLDQVYRTICETEKAFDAMLEQVIGDN